MNTLSLFFAFILAFGSANTNGIQYAGTYSMVQTVLMKDSSEDAVGYQISGTLNVDHLLVNLLLVTLESPQLHIMSRKAPTPHGFVVHHSNLESASNKPFLISINNGLVEGLYADDTEHVSMINLKRGIASLFQFKTEPSGEIESDASGNCTAQYKYEEKDDSIHVSKNKIKCEPAATIKETLWGGKLESVIHSDIFLSVKGRMLQKVSSFESHSLQANLTDFASIKVTTETEMKLTEQKESSNIAKGDVHQKVEELGKSFGAKFSMFKLFPEKEPSICKGSGCTMLSKTLQENKKHLQASELGNSKSALNMLRLIHVFKEASADEIYSIINAKENKKVLPQLMDILGAVQTKGTHQAALKKLKINAQYDLDLCERYLWALSTSPKCEESIIRDIMQIVNAQHSDPKLWQTLVLTMTGMARKLGSSCSVKGPQVVEEVVTLMNKKLGECKKNDESCKRLYMKGFANLAAPSSLPTLIKYATESTSKTGTEAINAISKLGLNHWNKEVLQLTERVYLSNNTYDSSSRTIALDILLETKPSFSSLAKILSLLRNKYAPFELKEYLLQRLQQISESDPDYGLHIRKVLHQEGLYQYNSMAQGGLSSAFSRKFSDQGTLSTTQEVFSGVLKRGNVHVNLNFNNTQQTLFTLGIFSSGLTSFVSGDGGEEEAANAGLELTVLGVGLRPFVFFEGQGELLSHVWSGTASTLTPAYQALLSLEQQDSYIALGTGALANVRLFTSASVDLSGQIEISLWYKNAASLVRNSAGLAMEGAIQIDSHFVKTQVEFNLMAEPRLDLTSDIEFSEKVALCMQLQQPDSAVRYNTYKVERIPGSKHKLRKSRYKTISVPGKTYVLNMKSNEMCNMLHTSES